MMNTSTFPWPVHPAAELFPLLDGEELRDLTDDIRKHGLLEPVWLYRDPERGVVLLDGRNRFRACEQAGQELRMRYYDGTDPIQFSLSENLKRRHLSAGQIAFVALEAEKLYAAEAARNVGGRPRLDETKPVADRPQVNPEERKSRERAAKAVGAKGRNVSKAKRVAEHAPDLAEQVRSGAMALDRADRRLRDREAEQKRIEQAHRENEASNHPVTTDIRHGGIGHRADACDRDWTEYCHFCWEPLGIYEEVRDRGQDLADKSTGVTERLARRATLPAGLIAWHSERPAETQAEIDQLHKRLRELEALHPITGFVVRALFPRRAPFEHITTGEHWRRIALMHAEHESQCGKVPRLERWRLTQLRAKAQRQTELWRDTYPAI